jgi:TolB protein
LIIIACLGFIFAGLWLALIGASVAAGHALPDGGKVVFDSSWNGNRERMIYMVDVDSGTFHNLTLHQHMDGVPMLSPDSRQIAFISVQNDMGRLYVTDLAIDSVRRLDATNGVGRPTWSPDGRYIAYEWAGAFYVTNLERDEVSALTSREGGNWYPIWSPDGSRFAFVSSRDTGIWQIYSIEFDGSNVKRLTHTDQPCTFPAWSPDGRRIAFEMDRAIYVMDADGSSMQQISSDTLESSWGPVWSPDGSAVLFTASASDNHDLYLANPDTGDNRRLTDHPALDEDPHWSPDGTHIVFESDRDSIYWGIYILDVDTGDVRRLVDRNIGTAGWWP